MVTSRESEGDDKNLDDQDDAVALAPREPVPPLQGNVKERLSFFFPGRTLGEILLHAVPPPRLQWRASDRVLMKSFLSFCRLGSHNLRSVISTPSSVDQYRDVLCRIKQDIFDADADPDLHILAARMNVDLASLSDAKWDTIKTKMYSCMQYILKVNTRDLRPEYYWDVAAWARRL
ncbi:uncharacterized protein LY79DRAFT_584476 [Colletotrichum navitas]|uniref:Uncharacterized protein n=1 Tax=Colletotrichum navitas TaxID=681940 RepID=A0AAD8UYL7_9PEZI|nr:uncharacterized protein LY79DRAFT_584476 [Colletotrichum navitas]KAK1569822.1 hypothetical protein LY79DRAFT_584476 [Colletotrichum navitas]